MASKKLMHSMLKVLVQEWGRAEVEAALMNLDDMSLDSSESFHVKKKSTRLRAVEQVERSRFLGPYQSLLIDLAAKYDRKEVLPTTADVREFLMMMGQRPGNMKDRSDAFRKLLVLLSEVPRDRVEKLIATASHSGPSQLGPLSDAISASAEALEPHRRREADSLKR
jgi:hypothetical protein